MKFSTFERWASAIGIVGIVGAAYWLGSLETRVSKLEKSAEQVAMGPRGQNCQQIVAKLVEKPSDPSLKQLASEWGCSEFAAATGPAPDSENQVNDVAAANKN